MGVAANKGQMNPLFWDGKDPNTAFEVFSGFAIFISGLFEPVGSLHSFGKDLMKYGTFAYAFASVTGSTAALAAYGNCALTNGEADPSKWNWKENWADTILFAVFALETVMQLPMRASSSPANSAKSRNLSISNS